MGPLHVACDPGWWTPRDIGSNQTASARSARLAPLGSSHADTRLHPGSSAQAGFSVVYLSSRRYPTTETAAMAEATAGSCPCRAAAGHPNRLRAAAATCLPPWRLHASKEAPAPAIAAALPLCSTAAGRWTRPRARAAIWPPTPAMEAASFMRHGGVQQPHSVRSVCMSHAPRRVFLKDTNILYQLCLLNKSTF
jgi:hypothetical protein